MQSRRRGDFAAQSPPPKFRDSRRELGQDHYAMPRRDMLERPPRSRRSLSPRQIEASRRVLGGDRRSNSRERRDYGWRLGGLRGDRVRSRSPPYVQVHKRPHYEEGISAKDLPSQELQRRYDHLDYMDMNIGVNTGLKHDYGFEHGSSRMVSEKGLFDAGGHERLNQKSLVLEESAAPGSLRFPRNDFGPSSQYFEGGDGSFPSSSAKLDFGHFKDERVPYPDSLFLGKFSHMESHERGEKTMFRPSDVSYPTVPQSQSKDIMGAAQYQDSTVTGISRANLSRSYRDGVDEYSRSSAKLETSSIGGYGDRLILDPGRFPGGERKDSIYYPKDNFSPTRNVADNYLHSRPGERLNDEYRYPSDQHGRMSSFEQTGYDDRDLLRWSMMDPKTELVDSVGKHVDNTRDSNKNYRDSNIWDNQQTFSNYQSMSKLSTAGDSLDSRSAEVEFGRRVAREQQVLHMPISGDHAISHSTVDYNYGREVGPSSNKERIRRSPELKYEEDYLDRVPARTHGMRPEEFNTYDLSDRELKRKYIMDEEMPGHKFKSSISSRLNYSTRTKDLDKRSVEWFDRDAGGLVSSKSMGYDRNIRKREQRTSYGADQLKDAAPEDWLSSRDLDRRSFKAGSRHLKAHSKPGPSNLYNTNHFNRKNVLAKPHNVWIRGKNDNEVDTQANKVEKTEDLRNSGKSEPPEDSEEFKHLVQKAFLTFTKKLNENAAVKKRYEQQGRAGSLFCIVCGRSLSKEFVDTQRLATHAYMSHKVGLRAQHLGLHKAICVMLGWNSEVAPDVMTWVPKAISSAEANAQKEDLILWPPVVVIHNVSISGDPQGKTIVSVESLGEFLRGKGFGMGKVKVCPGKPGNSSIMIVKFLGTFTGVEDAEKLHKYFAEKNHGRTDLVTCSKQKSKSSSNGDDDNDILEAVLYGYSGIAEDLDKVDLDTKRKCTIKSKEEIQDLVNAPLKPQPE